MSSDSSQVPSADLMAALMKDPVKKALLLQLLNQEKHNLEKYKKELKTKTTPLKTQTKRLHCESPTALHRRRALEEKDTSESSSSSDLSEVAAELKGPQLPFEQLLRGVRAYVEVKRDNEDRSEGIKAVMRLMGATIRDKFSNDVTHVVFKDGSFTTFEKAKLMKIHLVSVLWLDAVRRNNARVPEKNYPAFGNRVCDENVSILCSQIQKDYEDVVKDERRRRHTMMTPKTSMSSYVTAQNIALSDNETLQNRAESPDLTSDDSDCGVIDGHTAKRSKDSDLLQNSLLTNDSTSTSTKISSNSIASSDSTSLLSRVNKNKRKTIHICSDIVLTPNIPRKHQTHSSENIVEGTPQEIQKKNLAKRGVEKDVTPAERQKNIGKKELQKERTPQDVQQNSAKKVVQNASLQSSVMSSLRVSSESDKTKSGLSNNFKDTKSSAEGKENCTVTTVESTMSSLRLSRSSARKSDEKNNGSSSSRLRRSSSVHSKGSDKVTVRKTKNQKAILQQPNHDSCKTSESEEEIPQKDETPARNRKSTSSRSAEISQTIDQIHSEESTSNDDSSRSDKSRKLDLQNKKSITDSKKGKQRRSLISDSEDDTSTKSNQTRAEDRAKTKSLQSSSNTSSECVSKKLRRRTLFDTTDSDFDEETQPKKLNRRATTIGAKSDAIKEDDRMSTRSRRSSSEVSSARSSVGDNSRSRRSSLARTTSETNLGESPEFLSPRAVKRGKRASSVVPPKSEPRPKQTSNIVRRSMSVDRTTLISPKVVLTRPESLKTQHKDVETTPSPAKKLRVEEPSTSKKRRKLYNPNDVFEVTGVSPPEIEREREEYQKQKSQKSPDDMFVNPNDIQLVPLPSRPKPNTDVDVGPSDDDDDEFVVTKTKTKTGKKDKAPAKKVPPRDSAADEQRELLALLELAEKQSQNRYSKRLSLSQTNPKYTFSSTSSDSLSVSSLPITPIKRRSTLDFVSLTQSQQKRKLKLDPRRTTSIVCTKLHRREVRNFENTVGGLGRFFVEDKVTGKTSHLVAGEAKRTINMLRAIARGCWILKHEWLLKSQESGKWLDEEDYELTEFSPAVQQCRLQKEAFGPLYSMDIFKDCGYIYVGKATTPKTADLKELLSICKGRVTTVYRNATIIIGEYIKRDGIACVTEMWVLDSVHFNKLKSFKHYLIKPESQNGSPHV